MHLGDPKYCLSFTTSDGTTSDGTTSDGTTSDGTTSDVKTFEKVLTSSVVKRMRPPATAPRAMQRLAPEVVPAKLKSGNDC
jgi:hypothetical protein